ncbi:MAG UNVERIFIED_CONTAM: ribosome recycling factor [Planctomycetaceae bacterium]|jgi:ribosome recycling factor
MHSKVFARAAANPGLVDSVRVEYYGSPTPLKQIANISCPEPQQILIRPFDGSTLDAIARGIIASELGMVPNNDGRMIPTQRPATLNGTPQADGFAYPRTC